MALRNKHVKLLFVEYILDSKHTSDPDQVPRHECLPRNATPKSFYRVPLSLSHLHIRVTEIRELGQTSHSSSANGFDNIRS
jgi:hypothetical protein